MSFVERITRFLFIVLLASFLFVSIYFERAGYAGLFGLFLGTALERLAMSPPKS